MALKLAYLVDFFSKHVTSEQLEIWQGKRSSDEDAELPLPQAANDAVALAPESVEIKSERIAPEMRPQTVRPIKIFSFKIPRSIRG